MTEHLDFDRFDPRACPVGEWVYRSALIHPPHVQECAVPLPVRLPVASAFATASPSYRRAVFTRGRARHPESTALILVWKRVR